MDEITKETMLSKLMNILEKEYGRRNIHNDNEEVININYYSCGVSLYIHDRAVVAYAFMSGEGDYMNFPVDGSKYTLEMLARNTVNGPGSYVNVGGDHFVPNYSFMFRSDDVDDGDFVIRVIDRLADLAGFNSMVFDDWMSEMNEGGSDQNDPSDLEPESGSDDIVKDTDSFGVSEKE